MPIAFSSCRATVLARVCGTAMLWCCRLILESLCGGVRMATNLPALLSGRLTMWYDWSGRSQVELFGCVGSARWPALMWEKVLMVRYSWTVMVQTWNILRVGLLYLSTCRGCRGGKAMLCDSVPQYCLLWGGIQPWWAELSIRWPSWEHLDYGGRILHSKAHCHSWVNPYTNILASTYSGVSL